MLMTKLRKKKYKKLKSYTPVVIDIFLYRTNNKVANFFKYSANEIMCIVPYEEMVDIRETHIRIRQIDIWRGSIVTCINISCVMINVIPCNSSKYSHLGFELSHRR